MWFCFLCIGVVVCVFFGVDVEFYVIVRSGLLWFVVS